MCVRVRVSMQAYVRACLRAGVRAYASFALATLGKYRGPEIHEDPKFQSDQQPITNITDKYTGFSIQF